MDDRAVEQVDLLRIEGSSRSAAEDRVAVEEPLEIRVIHGREATRTGRPLAITMRTPGHDVELAAGFLFTEGILDRVDRIRRIEPAGPNAPGRDHPNVVEVELDPDTPLDLERLQRHFFSTSSCGVCGKASLDSLRVRGLRSPPGDRPVLREDVVRTLPDALRAAQPWFAKTGGIHAAGWASAEGALQLVREDIGRHNAVDKLIGRRFLDGELPGHEAILAISGRAGFEIVQKAVAAGIPVLMSVGAPSSLAVSLAAEFGLTLIGFASDDRFNVYSGASRLA